MKRCPHTTIAQDGNYGKLPPSSRSADFRRRAGVNAGTVLRGTHEDDVGNPSSKPYAPVRQGSPGVGALVWEVLHMKSMGWKPHLLFGQMDTPSKYTHECPRKFKRVVFGFTI